MSKERKTNFVLGFVSIVLAISALIWSNAIFKLISIFFLSGLIASVIVIPVFQKSEKILDFAREIVYKYDLHPEWEAPIFAVYIAFMIALGLFIFEYSLVFFFYHYFPAFVPNEMLEISKIVQMASFMYLFALISLEILFIPFTLIIIYKNK